MDNEQPTTDNGQQTTDNGRQTTDPDLARLETLATWLDNRFRIPGTNLRFGLDGIIGLVPYLGDMAGFVVSGGVGPTPRRRPGGGAARLLGRGEFGPGGAWSGG